MSFFNLRKGALVAALALGATAGSAVLSVPALAEAQTPAARSGHGWGLGRDHLGDQAAFALLQLDIHGVSSAEYSAERSSLATGVATRLGLDGLQMTSAWARADVVHQRAMLTGLSQLGVPYRRNTSKMGQGFDCSGLTTFAWGQAGVGLTRQSGAQINAATARTADSAEAGDLVYYPGHVMLWLGVGRAVVHAPYPGQPVEVKIQGGNRSLRFGDPTG